MQHTSTRWNVTKHVSESWRWKYQISLTPRKVSRVVLPQKLKLKKQLIWAVIQQRYKVSQTFLISFNFNFENISAIEDQLNVMKKHLEQYKEIGEANEQAISDLTTVRC